MTDMADVVRKHLHPQGRPSFKHMAGQAKKVPCRKTSKPGEGRCCCNCVYHHPDQSHPMTDGIHCMHVRGWICGAPEVGFSSGWGRHGFCECHAMADELRRQHDAAALHRVLRLLPARLREAVETDLWYEHEQMRRKSAGGR